MNSNEYILKSKVKGHSLSEHYTTTVKLPKRTRKYSKVVAQFPKPGNKVVTYAIEGTNNAGNMLTDTKQSKFSGLASLNFDGTNTTPDDAQGKVAHAVCTSEYTPWKFDTSKMTAAEKRAIKKSCKHK